MKILESYKDMMMEFVNEVDDDKIIKYKKKDGEQGEMKAGSAKSMPKDHPAKIAWDKMQDDGDGEAVCDDGDYDKNDHDSESGLVPPRPRLPPYLQQVRIAMLSLYASRGLASPLLRCR